MNYVKKKNKCGTKDQNYNGSKVEIRTQSSFMGQQLNESEEISLRGFEIVKEWQPKEGLFTKMLTNFYVGLFTTSNPHNLDSIMDGV